MKLNSFIHFVFVISVAVAYGNDDQRKEEMVKELNNEVDINSLLKSLVAKQQNAKSGCACLQAIDLWVKTSTLGSAETGGTHQLEIKRSNGESNKFVLSGIPGQGQSKLFTFSLDDPLATKKCASIFDIESIVINAVSTDGWNVNSAVTVLADSKNHTFTGSIDRNIDAWVDHQDLPQYEQLVLSLTSHN